MNVLRMMNVKKSPRGPGLHQRSLWGLARGRSLAAPGRLAAPRLPERTGARPSGSERAGGEVASLGAQLFPLILL